MHLRRYLQQCQLIGEMRTLGYEEKDQYMDKIVANEAAKYMMPMLEKHAAEKAKATDLPAMIAAMEKEHKTYLHLNTHHEIAVYTAGNQKVSQNMYNAEKFEKHSSFNELKQLINHSVEYKIKDSGAIFKDLKESSDNNELFKKLKSECESHHKGLINKHLDHLHKGHHIKIDNQVFKEPVSYLNHLKRSSNNQFLPHQHIDAQLKEYEKQHEKGLDRQKELQLNKTIGGPNF